MKILCISDQKDPLIYSALVKDRFGDVDFVLSAGDLDLEYYGFIVSSLNKRLFFVFGNHNLKKLWMYRKSEQQMYQFAPNPALSQSYGATYLNGKVIRYNGLIIAGLGGTLKYNEGANQYSERQMYMRIFRLIPRLVMNKLRHGRYLDILLTHAAPAGIGDRPDLCHRGFRAFLWFIDKFQPKYLIHGHIHLYDLNARREFTYGETKILNVFSSYVLDIEDEP